MLRETPNFDQNVPKAATLGGGTGVVNEVSKSGELAKNVKKAAADKAKATVQAAAVPEKQDTRFSEDISRIQDETNNMINEFIREVSKNANLRKQITAFKKGELGTEVDPKLAELSKLYYKIYRYQNMVNGPTKFYNNTGYPYGKVNLLSSDPTNESVARRKVPDFIAEGMRTRIEEEAAELKKLMTVNKVTPPYPHIEKRGKIVNELPHGMGNPNFDKKKTAIPAKNPNEEVDVGGRPSEVDKDVHTTSWNREQKVNTHMGKAEKAEREFQKGIQK